MTKSFLVGCAALCGGATASVACTGISLTAKDGSYVQARTIEGAALKLISEYVIIPRGYEMQSYTPNAKNGLKFKAKYGVVGLCVVQKEFIAEGMNEAGLSTGLSSSLTTAATSPITLMRPIAVWATCNSTLGCYHNLPPSMR